MPSPRLVRVLWCFAAVAGAVLLAAAGVLGWRYFWPATAAEGWRLRVHADALPSVSALALEPGGGLFVSLELRHGAGRILRLAPDGSRAEVVRGLSKPDGMVMLHGGIAYSQEEGVHPVFWRRGETVDTLFSGADIESLATDGRYLYAVEDRALGARLLRYDPWRGTAAVIRDRLEVAEGVAVCPDGRVYYVEKKKARVSLLGTEGDDRVVIAHGLNAPGFLMCDARGLWIAEDATQMARLLLLGDDGRLRTVLSHLRSAQTIIPAGDGRYLLAEQGRNRILELTVAAP